MLHYHEVHKPFNIHLANGSVVRAVAIDNNEDNCHNCKCCIFAKLHSVWCSGHSFIERTCVLGGCKAGKCAPEYREDGKFIHYVKIR